MLAYVSIVTSTMVQVVLLDEYGSRFSIYASSANDSIRFSRLSDDVVRWVRPDGTHSLIKQDDFVYDNSFSGDFTWLVNKLDKMRGRAFLVANVSGRWIGHWQDLDKVFVVEKVTK